MRLLHRMMYPNINVVRLDTVSIDADTKIQKRITISENPVLTVERGKILKSHPGIPSWKYLGYMTRI